MYLNKVFIAGNLTRDPELKALPSGAKVCSFGVATNRYWRDQQSGERKEMTEFHNIVVFGRQAETTAQYLKKGSGILVEGRIQTRSWDGNDGQKRYRTEIVAESVQFGSRSGGGETQSVQSPSHPGSREPKQQEDDQPVPTIEYPDDDINPDDIPF